VGGVDTKGLLEDAEGRVAGDVEGEQARRADAAMVAEPDKEGGEREVPGQLVEKGLVEGGEALIAGEAVGGGYLQRPRQARRAAEKLLVEVVADPPDPGRLAAPGRPRP